MNSEPSFDLTGLGRRACRGLENVFQRLDSPQLELLGRERPHDGAIAVPLMHAGFQSYVMGEMVTPPGRQTGDWEQIARLF